VSPQPPAHVLAAFGVVGCVPVPLDGGQGTSWRAGDLVLKPAAADPDELGWQVRTFSQVSQDGFRLARPRPAADGSPSVDGWSATDFLSGRHSPRRWPDIIAAGDRLHRAVRGVQRPAFLDHRTDPWAMADRVAWNEIPATEFAGVPHLRRLTSALRQVAGPSQLIHGDLTGNVLFDDRLPPAIIDFSAYWRPVPYAAAVVVTDALVWESADQQILHSVRHFDDFGQYLVRALIFRIVTDWILSADEPRDAHSAGPDPWADTVDLASELAAAARVR
jgi:uncharacterized protein (TIGR02569 family)